MIIELYTSPGCSMCESTKKLLNERGFAFIEHQIGRDYTKDQVADMFPSAKFLPVVVVDGQLTEALSLPQLLLEG